MKKYIPAIILSVLFSSTLFAAVGDTTTVRVFNGYHMNTYGNHNAKALMPSADKSHQRVWLKFTLGCLSNGQCEWDYTVKLFARQYTGVIDSTLKQAPYLKVNGAARDSIQYSTTTTWVNIFNSQTKQTDSVASSTIKITLHNNSLKPLEITDSLFVYPVNYWRYNFDTSGKRVDSVWVSGTEIIRQRFTPYYEKFERINDIELGRFISPYAINFPKTFKYDYIYDVTDYAALLTDSTEFRIVYEGYSYGFTATWDMIFVEGTPAREVIDIVNVYNGYYNYGQSTSIEQALKAVNFTVPAGTALTRARIIITGHGGERNENCAEFCAKNMYLNVNNRLTATQLVWKDDCGENAIIAQPGTWVYNRANWCPGEKIRVYDYDLTTQQGTNTIDLDMEAFTANGAAGYNIALQLLHYKAPNYTTDASIEEVLSPTNNFWYNRTNPVCGESKFILRNNGSSTLTSAEISIKIGNGSTFTYNWSGSLSTDKETTVTIKDLPWPSDLSNNTFSVWLSKINGNTSDDNTYNNTKQTNFNVPLVLPAQFIIETRTNAVPQQNSYQITDINGDVVLNRSSYASPNTMFRDTFNLKFGCYKLKFKDSGNNGLGWWAASSEGNGMFRIVSPPPIRVLRNFGLDFGSSIELNFMVNFALGNEELLTAEEIGIYPNPANHLVEITGLLAQQIDVLDMTGKVFQTVLNSNELHTINWPTGMYLLRITSVKGQVVVKKLLVQHQ